MVEIDRPDRIPQLVARAFRVAMQGRRGPELRQHQRLGVLRHDPSSLDTLQKFMADLQMFANNMDGIDPESCLTGWTCNRIPQPANNWIDTDDSRCCNKNYDALAEELAKTIAPDKRADISKKMNDMLVEAASSSRWSMAAACRRSSSSSRF